MRLRLSPIGPMRVQSITIIAILNRAGMSLIDARREVESAHDAVSSHWTEFEGDVEALNRELMAVDFRAVTEEDERFAAMMLRCRDAMRAKKKRNEEKE